MTDDRMVVQDNPQQSDIDQLSQALNQFQLPGVHGQGFKPLAVFAYSGKEQMLGGAYGHLNWTWFHLSLLWVSDQQRSLGLGSRLLNTIEQAAFERGCRKIHLETYSYQVQSFYKRHGYLEFARLVDYAPGYDRLYLHKDLDV